VVRRKDAYPWLQIECSRCEQGAYCVGRCWALMLLLFVGGVMNLIWAAFLATMCSWKKYCQAELLSPGLQALSSLSVASLSLPGR
jgi:predicted metal-binding membrane protein